MNATTSTGQLNLNAVAQVLASLTGANTALSSNQTGLNATSAIIGFLSPAQGAWNQNSGARVNNASIWNQYIQLATLTAQLLNQKNLNGIASASAASGFLNLQPRGGDFDQWRADAEHKRDRHPDRQCVLQLGGATTGGAASGGGAPLAAAR